MKINTRGIAFLLLCIEIMMIPFELLIVIEGFATGIFIVAAAALFFTTLSVISRQKIRQIPGIILYIVSFTLWAGLSILWSIDRLASIDSTKTYILLFLAMWMFLELVEKKEHLWKVMRSYILGCYVSLILLYSGYISGSGVYSPTLTRFSAANMNQNRLAFLLDVGIIFSAFLLLRSASKGRFLYWLYMPFAAFGVLLTGSRAGSIVLVFSLAISVALIGKNSINKMALGLVLLGCAGWLAINFIPSELLDRVQEGSNASTFKQREKQWRDGIARWKESPLQGVGTGAFIPAVVGRGGEALYAHNTYIQILVEDGIVGISILGAFWCLLIFSAWNFPKMEKWVWLGVGCSWAIISISGTLDYAKITYFIYGCIIAQANLFDKDKQ